MAPPSLSAEQLAFYGTYGYLLLPQWIPPPLLTALQDETEAVNTPTPHPTPAHPQPPPTRGPAPSSCGALLMAEKVPEHACGLCRWCSGPTAPLPALSCARRLPA